MELDKNASIINEKKKKGYAMSPIWKGFLIGSSLGIFAALFGITDNMPRSVLLGIIGGLGAGLTFKLREGKKK